MHIYFPLIRAFLTQILVSTIWKSIQDVVHNLMVYKCPFQHGDLTWIFKTPPGIKETPLLVKEVKFYEAINALLMWRFPTHLIFSSALLLLSLAPPRGREEGRLKPIKSLILRSYGFFRWRITSSSNIWSLSVDCNTPLQSLQKCYRGS